MIAVADSDDDEEDSLIQPPPLAAHDARDSDYVRARVFGISQLDDISPDERREVKASYISALSIAQKLAFLREELGRPEPATAAFPPWWWPEPPPPVRLAPPLLMTVRELPPPVYLAPPLLKVVQLTPPTPPPPTPPLPQLVHPQSPALYYQPRGIVPPPGYVVEPNELGSGIPYIRPDYHSRHPQTRPAPNELQKQSYFHPAFEPSRTVAPRPRTPPLPAYNPPLTPPVPPVPPPPPRQRALRLDDRKPERRMHDWLYLTDSAMRV